jgi:hypothetical protein
MRDARSAAAVPRGRERGAVERLRVARRERTDRAVGRELYEHSPGQFACADLHRRVHEVEAVLRGTVSACNRAFDDAGQRQRMCDVAREHDARRARVERDGRGLERTQHVDHHCAPAIAPAPAIDT